MPRRDEPFEEHSEEQEQDQGWYFDLPSGAWERTRQVHRHLREQLLEGKPGEEKQPERDPFTGLPIEQPKGLFGRFRRKKPRLPEELERELRTRQQSKRGKQKTEQDDWSTEGRALSIERVRDEAPLIVRRSAPPPPPAEDEPAAPTSRWDQIFGGVEDAESPLEAMRRWARGEALSTDEPRAAEAEATDESVPLETEEAEEPDPIIEFMSHELAQRARARWEEEHGATPLTDGVEETTGTEDIEDIEVIDFGDHAPGVEPGHSRGAEPIEPQTAGRSMRWEDAFGSPSTGEEEDSLEAMRRWARGEPLAHGAGWERFDRPQDEEAPVIDATEEAFTDPHIERRRSIFARFRRPGEAAAEADDAVAASSVPPSEPEVVGEEHRPSDEVAVWPRGAATTASDDDVATIGVVEERSEWQSERFDVSAIDDLRGGPTTGDEDEWSWAPEPTSAEPIDIRASAPLRAEPALETEPDEWAEWGFGDEKSDVADTEPRGEDRVDAFAHDEATDWMAAWQPEGVAEGPTASASIDTPTAREAPSVAGEPAPGDFGLAEPRFDDEGTDTNQSWWDVFDATQDQAQATAESAEGLPRPGVPESLSIPRVEPEPSGKDQWAAHEPARTADRDQDELLAAWDEIAAASGVDPATPPPPPLRSSAVRRQAWDIPEAPPPEAEADEQRVQDGARRDVEETRPASQEEPLWVPAEEPRDTDEEDIILKAFEAHAAAADDDEREPVPEPGIEGRRRLSLRDLLGDDAEDLLAAADETDEPISFAQMHGWVPHSTSGTEAEEDWAPAFDGQTAPLASSSEEMAAEPVARRRRVNWVREVVEIGLMAVLLFLGIRATFQNFQVDGTSMYPTLVDGEFLLVNKLAYQTIDLERLSTFLPFIDPGDDGKVYVFGPPQRGDIVVFRDPMNPSVDLIKRVIGLPGEKVEIVGGKVFINDQLLQEPYVQGQWFGDRPAAVVPEGHYFVLGDNRDNSKDSRSPQIGYVPEDLIIGKAIVTLWPRDRFGLAPNNGGTLVNEAPPTESARHVD